MAGIRAAKQGREDARGRTEQAAKAMEAQGSKVKDESQRKRWYPWVDGVPSQKGLGNPTDLEFLVMIDGANACCIQGCDTKTAVDQRQQMIVAAAVTKQQSDRMQLAPMADTGKATSRPCVA
ncbi:hypothetical protein [Paludibaculum fermentans]|uniref:hypothetical protein n=1 Tax=Paludibaculum fermentans TaxID=1473598 RepID=UPI003EC0DA51